MLPCPSVRHSLSASPRLHFAPSPCLPLSASPSLRSPLSPSPPLTPLPRLPLSVSPCPRVSPSPLPLLSPRFPLLLACLCLLLVLLGSACRASAQEAMSDIQFFSSLKDRSTGSQGAEDAADYILKAFSDAGLSNVGSQEFLLPIPEVASASLEGDGESLDLYPWGPNLVYLPMTPETGLQGPLLYAEDGDFEHFNGRDVKGSIVLMDHVLVG